jgi:hypothetical protein
VLRDLSRTLLCPWGKIGANYQVGTKECVVEPKKAPAGCSIGAVNVLVLCRKAFETARRATSGMVGRVAAAVLGSSCSVLLDAAPDALVMGHDPIENLGTMEEGLECRATVASVCKCS